MRTTTTARIGASAAGALLALGIFAAAPPAEASSGHRPHGVNSAGTACFTATGKTQGRSHSDPDGMSNGGADKPGCTGGFDADRDGNNGCGNDADREDDNNGNCGRQKTRPAAPAPAVKVEAEAHQQSADHDTPKVEAKHDEADDDVVRDRQHGCHDSLGSSTTSTTVAGPAVAGVALTASGNCGCVLGAAASAVPAAAAPAAATLTALGSTPSGSAAITVSGAAATSPDTGATEAGSTGPAGTEVAAADTTVTTQPATVVLGENVTRPSSTSTRPSTLPGALARTGAALGGLVLVGAGLAWSGRLTAFSRRFLHR